MAEGGTLLLTGATGLVGGALLRRFQLTRPGLRLVILTRQPLRVTAHFRNARTAVVRGDLREPNVGLSTGTRRDLQAHVTEILHAAADTRFGLPLEEARAVNTRGTRRLLELARRCPRLEKFAYVSTVYVAGRCTGTLPEAPCSHDHGFVNTYQQSKWEAEQLVIRAMDDIPAVIFRLSTVVGDAATGRVRQFNYVHQLLKLLPHAHLLPVMPCEPHAPADLIPTEWAVAALAYLFEVGFRPGQVYQVCAGPRAGLSMGRLMDATLDLYASHPAARKWQPLVLPRPVDLATWEAYVRKALPGADVLLQAVLRMLQTFAPHLALVQAFENRRTLAVLDGSGLQLPPLLDTYARVVRYCLDTNWGRHARLANPGR